MKRILSALTLPVRMVCSMPLLIGFYLVGHLHLRAERMRRERDRRWK